MNLPDDVSVDERALGETAMPACGPPSRRPGACNRASDLGSNGLWAGGRRIQVGFEPSEKAACVLFRRDDVSHSVTARYQPRPKAVGCVPKLAGPLVQTGLMGNKTDREDG